MKQGVLAIIPARGGSKGVPRKNLRPFAGRALITHSIRHAIESASVTRTIVTTDDAEIARVSRKAGAEVIDRPAELATDAAPSEPSLLHVLESLASRERYVPELVVFLQATSPLRDPGDVDAAVALLRAERADSLLSACPSHDFHWTLRDGVGVPLNYDPTRRPRRQDLPPQFRENGSIYAMRASGFVEYRCRLFGRVAIYAMPEERSLQIDRPEDFALLEAVHAAGARPRLAPLLADLGLVVFDFDGVMTDNRVLVMQDGTEGVLCNRSDGLGLGMLKEARVPVLVLSKEKNPVVAARCRKLGLECIQGIDDKLAILRELLGARGISAARTAYVGNDLNDLACMGHVGLPIAVGDAYPEVLDAACYVTRAPGGHGAVREVCDLILDSRNSTEKQP